MITFATRTCVDWLGAGAALSLVLVIHNLSGALPPGV